MKPTYSLLLLIFSLSTVHAQSDYARNGILDLREWNFEDQGYVELNGEWEFFMSQLLTQRQLDGSDGVISDYVDFPSTWNELSKSLNPGNGFGTYRLRALITAPQQLALEIPHFYSNYTLWINGEKVASNGKVGETKEQSEPQWLPQTVMFDARQDTLDILIHVSNFHHAKGGVREPLRLGTKNELLDKREIAVTSNAVTSGGLVIIAFAFIIIYFFKPASSALYFAALCLTWALRECFSNLYIVTAAYPDFPWDVSLRIEYITLYLTMIWAAMFFASIFPNDVSSLFKYLFVACNLIFLVFTLLARTSFFTQFLPVYLSIAAVLLMYFIYVIIHAVVNDRKGVWFMISCMMLGIIVFSYDLISYEGFASYSPLVINIGYLAMFLLTALCLCIQYGFIKRAAGNSDMLTYEDLYGSSRK